MMTVRFETGLSIRYNDANYVERYANYSDLYTSKEKTRWVAQVPHTAVIEVMPACSVYNPVSDVTHERLVSLEREVRGLRRDVKATTKERAA